MSQPHTQQPLDTPVPLADKAVPLADDSQEADAAAEQADPSTLSTQTSQSVPPSEYVFQLILEQFWGDGVSKREIRSVYTTASDANAACHDYLLRTWPRDQFSLYEIGASPQRPELAKVSAQINGDRFHVWVERHSWEGVLDFSSKAIARRVGKGPNAYILQRTIKDASGGKRRSTTRGIYATRQLAKQALAQDEPPTEWSSNQGYILEPGGEYAHALSPSGKTAWLFIEVRPLYMNYTRLGQEEQETAESLEQDASGGHVGMSALNPISLDHGDDSMSSLPASPSAFMHLQRPPLDNPFSPMPSNPDEAGAFVYLVLQLKTIPYTPPILTVEAVAYELEVANRFGVALLENFTGAEAMSGPVYREDGCLQGSVEQQDRDEGLTVWVEKRAVVLGDEALEFDLMSEHGSVQSSKIYASSERDPNSPYITSAASVGGDTGVGRRKRGEPESGFEAAGRQAGTYPLARLTSLGAEEVSKHSKDDGPDARYKVVSITHLHHHQAGAEGVNPSSATAAGIILDSSNDLAVAILSARMQFYSTLAKLDITSVDVKDELERSQEEKGKVRSIQVRSRSEPGKVLQEVRVEDSQEQ
ncbi:hypothetical protein EC968_010189 [Mortierella alpina]|nr:hypothetical protein EC968_010189 [Mortierella alpina]